MREFLLIAGFRSKSSGIVFSEYGALFIFMLIQYQSHACRRGSFLSVFVQCAVVGIKNLRGYTRERYGFLYSFHKTKEGVTDKWHFL